MNFPQYERLAQIIKDLRDPQQGCPWNREQTEKTLLKYLIEECCELIEAVEKGDSATMKEELGDVLFQVLLMAAMAQERGDFDGEDVSQGLADKLVRRHPHVFGERRGEKLSSEQVEHNWEETKRQEKKDTEAPLPLALSRFPGLRAAHHLGKKVALWNFDWDDASQVAYKVEEEWQELKEELALGPLTAKGEELGDLLFSTAQLARHLNLDPEEALIAANVKFIRRFNKMYARLQKDNRDINTMNQKELDHYWNQVKREET